MNQDNDTEINTAFTQGLIGLAALFFVLKENISPINTGVFISLIMSYVVFSLIRVFGIILEVDSLNRLSVSLFSILGVPWTLYVSSRILITELFPNTVIFYFIPTYVFLFSMFYMTKKLYSLEININVKWKNK